MVFGIGVKKSKNKPKTIVGDVKEDLKRYRRQFDKGWRQEEEAYHGKIWRNSQGFRPYENHIFKIIEGEVPILTDSFPGTTIKTEDPEFIAQANSLDKAIVWVYKNQDFQLKLPMVIRNSLMAAPGWLYTYYDANANNGDGEIKQEVLRWQNVYLHGGNTFIEEAESARIELSRSRTWLILNYPKFKKELEDAKDEHDHDDNNNRDRGLETVDTGSTFAQRDVPRVYRDDDTLQLVLTFKRDYTIVDIPDEDTIEELKEEALALEQGDSPDISKWQNHLFHIEQHNAELEQLYAVFGLTPQNGIEAVRQVVDQVTEQNPDFEAKELFLIKILEDHNEAHKILAEENPKGGRLKYPSGLRAIETVNEIILYDGKSKDDHNQIPIVPFYCYRNGTIYGFGETRNIIDSQRMQAVMLWKEYKGLQRVANPILLIDDETGLTDDEVTNEDGGKYFLPQGTGMRYLLGEVSNQVSGFKVERNEVMGQISGINEATQGTQLHPNQSGLSITKLQQQAIGRIRLKDRQNQTYSIKRLGELTAALILQYWTNDKIIDLEDVDGEASQVIFKPMDMQDLIYQVEIGSGSMAGIDKDVWNAVLLAQLNAGHITYAQYVKASDFPRKEQLLEFAKENDQTQAQIQQLNEQLQQIQIENLKFKAKEGLRKGVELLSKEEQQILLEVQRNEAIEQLTTESEGLSSA